jgi:pimeloyl-ACP methyl ester carboxylesterase
VVRLIVVDVGLAGPRNGPPADNSVTRALAKDTFGSEEELLTHYKAMNPALDIERARRPLMYNFRTLPDGRVTYAFDPALRERFRDPARLAERQRATDETRARARHVQVPVLLIRGANSDILTPDGAAETVAAFPNATLVEIPNTTHMVPTDDPAAFRTVIREWLGLPA